MTPDERADLKQKYLLALLKSDAEIWRARIEMPVLKGIGVASDDDTDEPKPSRHNPAETYLREDPCLHCGTHRRFTRDNTCVVCQKARDKRAEKIKKLANAAAAASQSVRRPTLGLRQTQIKTVPSWQAPNETPVEMTSD